MATIPTPVPSTKIVEPTKAVQIEKPNPLRVRDTTANSLWTVIGMKDCTWSAKAMELLKEHNENCKYIELNAEWQRRLTVEYSTRRLPAIFRGAALVGSFDFLDNYYKCSFMADSERF
jgi:glutaredoxin